MIRDHGGDLATPDDQRGVLCHHPEVMGRSKPVESLKARRFGGACGPDAKWLEIKGHPL